MEDISTSRFIVGIDLGTTNCSLCYVDQYDSPDDIRVFGIPQLVAVGEIGQLPLLPSFTYFPGEHELPDGALALPWNGGMDCAVGKLARELGARIPERGISSAKSWLAHSGVERTRPILPWGGELGRRQKSPVQISGLYLEHLRDAWNSVMGRKKDRDGSPCVLQEQQIVLTVPASFDEAARDLTLKAARLAGFRHLTLLEEPLAAFYAWLHGHRGDWQALVSPGDVVAVVDVGGGTTDFSLVEMDDGGVLRRKAVGSHLLLGGDNMDMALARQAEDGWKTRLSQRQWTMLCQECRRVKELLLDDRQGPPPEESSVRLSGLGSSVVASTRSFTFRRQDILDLILGQFFADIPLDSPAPERRSGLQGMGLPYAADPTVTRHLLHFLKTAGKSLSRPSEFARPTKVLFNGGVMMPQALRDHVRAVMARWCGAPVTELVSGDFSLAVAIGAANYGLARNGRAVRVKGGIANAYFLEILAESARKLLCVMPRDTDEGVECRLARTFRLQANTAVSFPLHASATRLGDKLGDVIGADAEDVIALPPLNAVLKYGRSGEAAELEVAIASRLSEVGTLEVWCESLHSEHRFPLTFGIRESIGADGGKPSADSGLVVDADRENAALEIVRAAFADAAGAALDSLVRNLEGALDVPRQSWPARILRRMADELLAHPEWRQTGARHESRWEHLLGFAMRPGFGVAGDEERVRKAWMLWHRGPVFAASADVAVNWHVLWRRLAAGLSAGQQSQMSGNLFRELVTRDLKTVIRKDDQLGLEKWRLVATLEKLPANFKLKCLSALIKGTGRLDDTGFWLVARLAARRLFAGTVDSVVPASKLEPLMPLAMQKARQANMTTGAKLALASAARLTGERTLDLAAPVRAAVADCLKAAGAPAELVEPVETLVELPAQKWQPELLGDSLPLGIQMD